MELQPWLEGKPHTGKVFAAIFPHSDDFTFAAGGLIVKLISEGYTGYFVRMTDDCMDSYGLSYGETAQRIDEETRAVAELFGIRKVYDLNYNNHYLDHGLLTEIRHRLILLFRFLKVDTVITFDPDGHYEENPDHRITGTAVEQACWMAGRQLDLPETRDMGILPHFVREKYYSARGPQQANCLIDIAPALEQKRRAVWIHRTPLDNMWRVYLETHGGAEHPEMGYEDFVRTFFTERRQEPCQGLAHYERYRYIAPQPF